MGHQFEINSQVSLIQQPGGQVQAQLYFNPSSLLNRGYNMLVEVSTASAFIKASSATNPVTKNSITVWAHFDTGASITSIDSTLATHLGLVAVGGSTIKTAAGPAQVSNYAIDLSFPGVNLQPFHNLNINSCNLGYSLAGPRDPRNFGLLLGRDVMSRWSIVWHGPTSTVLISD